MHVQQTIPENDLLRDRSVLLAQGSLSAPISIPKSRGGAKPRDPDTNQDVRGWGSRESP